MSDEDHAELVEAVAVRVAAMLDRREPVAGALLDADQAAAFLGVPPSWMRAEARANRVPHVKLGRYVRFDRVDLERWREARKEGPMHRAGGLRAA